jgi:hypothetical protein
LKPQEKVALKRLAHAIDLLVEQALSEPAGVSPEKNKTDSCRGGVSQNGRFSPEIEEWLRELDYTFNDD